MERIEGMDNKLHNNNNNNNNYSHDDDYDIVNEAPETIERKGSEALLRLATYFSAQFALTQPEQTTLGYFKSFLWTQTEYQGLSAEAVKARYDAAVSTFKETTSAINNVRIEHFDVRAKSQLDATLNGIKRKAQGNRFPKALSAWLDLIIKASTLEKTIQYIQESQKILEEHPVADVSPHLTTLEKPATSADFVRSQAFYSRFDAMETVAVHFPECRPNDVKIATNYDFQAAVLLSKTARQTEPSFEESLRTLYSMLALYPKLHEVLFNEAKKTQTNEPPNNFALHCAVIQTLLTTIATQNVDGLDGTLENHWKVDNELQNNTHSAIFKKHTFKEAHSRLIQFTIEGTEYTKAKFNRPLSSWLEDTDDESYTDLINVILEYAHALSAQLQNALSIHSSAGDVTKAFNPGLTEELLRALRLHISSDAFKQSLGIKPMAEPMPMAERAELLSKIIPAIPTILAKGSDAANENKKGDKTDNVGDANSEDDDTDKSIKEAAIAATTKVIESFVNKDSPEAKPQFGDKESETASNSKNTSAASSAPSSPKPETATGSNNSNSNAQKATSSSATSSPMLSSKGGQPGKPATNPTVTHSKKKK